jgi:tRNA-splicing endonuclease subunit Sen54
LPEEALFMIERGSMDLWWPMRGLEQIFPVNAADEVGGRDDAGQNAEVDEYQVGLPLSLQAAYSLLIGNEGERGKVSLQHYQVYSHLKRGGYNILRALPIERPPSDPVSAPPEPTLWRWLFSLLSRPYDRHPPWGPLVRPGLYRSYGSIYRQLALVPHHQPSAHASSQWEVEKPFQIHFHVWRSTTAFSKARPPPAEFYMTVVDAQESSVPTLEQIFALLGSTPYTPPKAEWEGPRRLYQRLKHGYRNVIVAVVDHGIVNYMRFGEGGFGEEILYHRFDAKGVPHGGKKGGRNGARGGKGGKRGRRNGR